MLIADFGLLIDRIADLWLVIAKCVIQQSAINNQQFQGYSP
jgi:hypothetical protein